MLDGVASAEREAGGRPDKKRAQLKGLDNPPYAKASSNDIALYGALQGRRRNGVTVKEFDNELYKEPYKEL